VGNLLELGYGSLPNLVDNNERFAKILKMTGYSTLL